MDKIKSSRFFKVISAVLIVTFVSLDIAYAYPPEHEPGNSTLAAPSILQQPLNEYAARFQQSFFSQGALLASIYDIGEYFFGKAEGEIEPLPARYADEAIRSALGKVLSGSGIEIVNIVPVEYLKKTSPDQLKAALSDIGFTGALPDEGVVFVLYRKGDNRFLVQIAERSRVAAANLPGYEWVVSDKYVVKYVPENYKKEAGLPASQPMAEPTPVAVPQSVIARPAEQAEAISKATISAPIAEVEVPSADGVAVPTATRRTLIVRAIMGLALLMLTFAPSLYAGEFSAGVEGLVMLDGFKNLIATYFIPILIVAGVAVGTHVFKKRYPDLATDMIYTWRGITNTALEKRFLWLSIPIPTGVIIFSVAFGIYGRHCADAEGIGLLLSLSWLFCLIFMAMFVCSVGSFLLRVIIVIFELIPPISSSTSAELYSVWLRLSPNSCWLWAKRQADPEAKRLVIVTFKEMGNTSAELFLIDALSDADPSVQYRAAEALYDINDPRLSFMYYYLGAMHMGRDYYEKLTKSDTDHIVYCLNAGIPIDAHYVPSDYLTEAYREEYEEYDTEDSPAPTQHYRPASRTIILSRAKLIIKKGNNSFPAGFEPSVLSLTSQTAVTTNTNTVSGSAQVKSTEPTIVSSFKAISKARAMELHIMALNADDPSVRSAAVNALEKIKDPRAVEALANMRGDGSSSSSPVAAKSELDFRQEFEARLASAIKDDEIRNNDTKYESYWQFRYSSLDCLYKRAMEISRQYGDYQFRTVSDGNRAGELSSVHCTVIVEPPRGGSNSGSTALASSSGQPAKTGVGSIIDQIARELSERKELSFGEMFALVRSMVPESMPSLRQALNDVEWLVEESGVSDEDMSQAIEAARDKYSLNDEETRILWLALTGLGQGGGSVEGQEGVAGSAQQSAQPAGPARLFEVVESALVGRRGEVVAAGRKAIESVAVKVDFETTAGIGDVHENMSTAAIEEKIERVAVAMRGMRAEDVSPEARAAVDLFRSDRNRLEAEGAVASLISMARRAKKERQKLIIGLETEWIPGIGNKGSLQKSAIIALVEAIDDIGKTLNSMGLDNVVVIRGSAAQLAGAVLSEASAAHTDMHNIVIMASAGTINSDSFAGLRNADEGDRPFLAGIDPTELNKLYEEFGESVGQQLHIRLASLLYLTLELAAGKEPPQNSAITSYDSKRRLVIFMPRAEPKDYEALKRIYMAERLALQAA